MILRSIDLFVSFRTSQLFISLPEMTWRAPGKSSVCWKRWLSLPSFLHGAHVYMFTTKMLEAFKVVLDVLVWSNQTLSCFLHCQQSKRGINQRCYSWNHLHAVGNVLTTNVSKVTFVRKISVLLQRDLCAAPDRGDLGFKSHYRACPALCISVRKNWRLTTFLRFHLTEKFQSKPRKNTFNFLKTVTLLQVCFGSAWHSSSSFVLQSACSAHICEY